MGVTLIPAPGERIEDATVVFERGRITNVLRGQDGEPAQPPAGVRRHRRPGAHVYAAFIEPYAEVAAPRPEPGPDAHWSVAVTPHREALAGVTRDGSGLPESVATAHRAMGFGAAHAVPAGGIFAGRTAVISLAESPPDASLAFDRIYRRDPTHALDFETASWRERRYPTSIIGAIAMMRQVLSDADWQTEHRDGPPNSLTPLERDRGRDDSASIPALGDRPLLFDTDHPLEILAAARTAAEFDRRPIAVTSGDEHAWLDAVADYAGRTEMALIVPLRYPDPPDLSTPALINATSYSDMLAWEQAPSNASRLADAGLTIALTAGQLPAGQTFHANLRKAIERGLTEDDALAALTTTPAAMLGVEDELGTIRTGRRANLIVADGPIFDEETTIRDLWIDGRRHEIEAWPDAGAGDEGFDGTWRLIMGDPRDPVREVRLTITGTARSADGPARIAIAPRSGADNTAADDAQADDESDDAGESPRNGANNEPSDGSPKDASSTARKVSVDGRSISFVLDLPGDQGDDDAPGISVLSGMIGDDGVIRGTGIDPSQTPFEWAALPLDPDPDTATTGDREGDAADAGGEEEEPETVRPAGMAPFGAYGLTERPPQEPLLIRHATIWTSGPEGIIENGEIALEDGAITHVGGPGSYPSDRARLTVLSARGKHITPGLIDAHSHTSLFRLGVNEAGQAVTAEVRIRDAIDPTSINWYRQLAGGLTSALMLHGSANPIGGQSQAIKLRWGTSDPEAFFIEDAAPGIKFALGENVKQSNWSIPDGQRTRYPQTRMGVETIIRDRFVAAREYADDDDRRRDLELETLAQILAGDRLVHCHSYRQDEILMLCRVAEDFGFTIGTFQHGLEVYKVAEAVRRHAIGASLFSDWWAFKFEVVDAIPAAGPLQTEAGVLTSYNSDSSDLARRMNVEAAKALAYARRGEPTVDWPAGRPRLEPDDALAFVTINPAIQLGIDHRTGSLRPGKDADLVVWSGDPLSTLSRVERTFVDGRELFSLKRDAAHRERVRSERRRLVEKILAAPQPKEDETATEPGEIDGPGIDGQPDPDNVPAEDEADPPASRWGRDRPRMLMAYARHLADQGLHADNTAPGDCGCGYLGFADQYRRMMEDAR